MDTLILNAAYQPINVANWQDVMIKLYSANANERVEIVATYKDRTIRSAHAEHPMPSVVRHIKFRQQKKKGIKFSRDNVWARDRGRCQYCGMQVPRNTYTYDHVMPKSRGGKTSWENIVTACAECNGRKRDQTPVEAKMKLRSIPMKPEFLPDEFKNEIRFKKGMPEEWAVWFGGYWHGSTEEEKKS